MWSWWRGRPFTVDLSAVTPEVFRLVVDRQARSSFGQSATGLQRRLDLRWIGSGSLAATYRTVAIEGWYRQSWWTPWWSVRAGVDRDAQTVSGTARPCLGYKWGSELGTLFVLAVFVWLLVQGLRDSSTVQLVFAALMLPTAWIYHRRNGRGRRTREEYDQALDELTDAVRQHFGSDVPAQVLVPDESPVAPLAAAPHGRATDVLAFRDVAEFHARMSGPRDAEPSDESGLRLRDTAQVLDGLPDEATFVCYLGPGASWTVPYVGYDAYRDR